MQKYYTGGIKESVEGRARFDAIEANRKALITECESQPGFRCSVPSFFQGLEYKLIKQMEIRDVRIAYAPADSIGKYGGDIDNWMWPRHTGDYSFYRAYMGKDGKPADFSEENVPFKPEHFLKVSAACLSDGDFVMAAGYPGSTSRYARLSRVSYTFDWLYPTYLDLVGEWIDTIEKASEEGSDARIKYEATLAGLNNFHKITLGQLSGAKRVGLVPRRAQLLSSAQTLYRNAIESEKPDGERESGFQERDQIRLKEGMERIERRFDPVVDQAVWQKMISMYLEQPEENRVASFDEAVGINGSTDSQTLQKTLKAFYDNTSLTDTETRLSWLTASREDFEKSDDPFIKLAVALFDTEMSIEDQSKTLSGKATALRPKYMKAIIEWQKSMGSLAYPDANSTLRVTYGNVMGGSPKDGLIYEPFTRLEGITEKDTGETPFNSPKKQLSLINESQYGPYKLDDINSVPVNFLTDLDSTGGNSGSATLNSKAELIGLLFDGTFESVNSDWDFDPKATRTIHVDTRYMLWVMEYVDGANNLIEEMTVVR